ncbi:MAG TPA: glycosyltransferase family 4 protein [Candidatus Saccharimonadales bacterium]|nr:glycosyltransferase family 4 protein [Candidatus Saccharimonadales bacterium]
MKVLMLGWELPPHNSGGLGVACYQLCKTLANKGADIEFVLPYSAEHSVDFMKITAAHPQDISEVIKSGIAYDSYKYIYTDGHEEWVDIFGQQLVYEHAVARLVEAREFDVIHAHDWLTFRAAIRAKERLGAPLFVHVHSVERDRAGGQDGNPLVREIEELAFTMADRVIAVSELTKKAIVVDYGIPPEKIDVVHNSIDVSDTEPLDPDNAYHYFVKMKEHGWHVVSNVGRLTIQKGLTNLMRAAKEVIDREPKTLFLLVGAGEQYYELINLAADLGIGQNVILTGFLRGKQWRDAFSIADLFVLPSISEPFGLTPLEAVGYGTPVLLSKQSGVSEILQNALKVDFWDIDEMANQIVGALRSESLRQELHTNAYNEYQKLSWHESAEMILNLYNSHMQGVLA